MASNVPPPPMPPPPPAPQAPVQPAAMPAPAPKKTSPLVWVLVGCGVIVLLVVLVLAVGGFIIGKKVKDFAKDAERNPAVAAAEMAVRFNPEIEVVDKDYDRGTITIRNKKTGEVLTMDAEDVKDGRIRFRNEKGEEVTFEGKGEGKDGQFKISTKDGEATFGTGAEASLPSWLAEYPGAETQGAYSGSDAGSVAGGYTFQTADSVQEVMDFYKDRLEGEGLKVTTSTFQQDGRTAGGSIVGQGSGGRETHIGAMRGDDGRTAVTVTYKQPK